VVLTASCFFQLFQENNNKSPSKLLQGAIPQEQSEMEPSQALKTNHQSIMIGVQVTNYTVRREDTANEEVEGNMTSFTLFKELAPELRV